MPKKRRKEQVKNLQVRLGKQAHERVAQLAEDLGGKTIAEAIRDSIEVTAVLVAYAKAGKPLMWEDPVTKQRTQVWIPGVNTQAEALVPEPSSQH